jgi:hypothetical protein
MRSFKHVLFLSLMVGGFFQKSFAVDILTMPSTCFNEDEDYVKATCFSLMKETFGNREYWMLILFPVFILSENAPSNINTAQLTELGYTCRRNCGPSQRHKGTSKCDGAKKDSFQFRFGNESLDAVIPLGADHVRTDASKVTS